MFLCYISKFLVQMFKPDLCVRGFQPRHKGKSDESGDHVQSLGPRTLLVTMTLRMLIHFVYISVSNVQPDQWVHQLGRDLCSYEATYNVASTVVQLHVLCDAGLINEGGILQIFNYP